MNYQWKLHLVHQLNFIVCTLSVLQHFNSNIELVPRKVWCLELHELKLKVWDWVLQNLNSLDVHPYGRIQWQRLTHDRPDLSSERAPQKDKTVILKKKSLVKCPRFWLDTKIYWLTDRQSQCDFEFDFDLDVHPFERMLQKCVIVECCMQYIDIGEGSGRKKGREHDF
jgi:hypothetical protein